MIQYRADWVLPVSGPPVRDGWVAVDRGRVVGVGRRPAAGLLEHDLGRVAVLPGLVNAHTHLELSYLRDAIAPAPVFVSWVRELVELRQQRRDPEAPDILAAVDEAIRHSVAAGTVLVGDISNTLATVGPLARSPLAAVVFYELIRFSARDADWFVDQASRYVDAAPSTDMVRVSLAAHAPYSVAPLVFRAIRRVMDRRPFAPCSVHLAESAEEVAFIEHGDGPWRQFLEERGAWDETWRAPGVSPVRYLDESGFLHGRVLAVHGVHMSTDDLVRLARRGATLVTCPRSNGHTGAGAPPISEFYASGVRIAIGTDSLASAPDLNVFAELATLRALAPDVPAAALIDSATRQGAIALGFDADFGTIEPGRRARLLAVEVPPGTDDVEEYLVSGVSPGQVRWLEDI